MEPSVTLFLAAVVAGVGFAVGQAIFAAIVGAFRK